MVDCSSQLTFAQYITTDVNDKQQFEPMLDSYEESSGRRSDKVIGDAGYWSKANAKRADEQTEIFIDATKDWKRRM